MCQRNKMLKYVMNLHNNTALNNTFTLIKIIVVNKSLEKTKAWKVFVLRTTQCNMLHFYVVFFLNKHLLRFFMCQVLGIQRSIRSSPCFHGMYSNNYSGLFWQESWKRAPKCHLSSEFYTWGYQDHENVRFLWMDMMQFQNFSLLNSAVDLSRKPDFAEWRDQLGKVKRAQFRMRGLNTHPTWPLTSCVLAQVTRSVFLP